jgi:hypothetical protein
MSTTATGARQSRPVVRRENEEHATRTAFENRAIGLPGES